MNELAQFIEQHCVKNDAVVTPVCEFVRSFRDHYPRWTKSEVVADLNRMGYLVGTIGRLGHGAIHVVGLTLRRSWTVRGGRLVQNDTIST